MDSYRLEVADMADGSTSMTDFLEQLRSMTSSDFVALASFIDPSEPKRWKYAAGSSNDRYRHMVIKAGQGLAGTALRLGRWAKLDDTHPGAAQQRRECPVMLAERLQAAAVFPLKTSSNLLIQGLLFIGKRTQPRYEEHETRAAQDNLEQLLLRMQEDAEEIAK